MVTATTNFYQAVINLQKVFLEQQRSQQTRQGSRRFYQEKKESILKGLTRYEYLFSDNYHRLTESGSVVTYPDLGHVEANQIYIDGLLSGQSFQETYLQVSRAFDRMAREAYDPTQSDRLISEYEKDLIQVYDDFGSGCIDIIRDNFGNPAETSSQIDKFQTKLLKWVRKMLNKQVARFWQQGIDWAEINLQQAKKKKKEADIYIPPNQDAIDALIERNLEYIKGMTEDQKKGIISELTEGMLRGEGIDQLVARISKYVDSGTGNGQSKAERIARTEVMYALNHGALSRYARDGIQQIQWLAGPDDRCCPTCIDNDGKVFPINNAPSLPAHVNCRCTWVPYFDENAKWVDDWTDNYKDSDVENYGVYDEFGNLIGSGSGTSTQVEIQGDTKDKTVIHNHPGTNRADFSNGDLKYAFSHDVKEMVVVTPTGSRCSISRPKSGWPDPESVEPAWKEVMNAHREDMKKISADEAYGKITLEEGLVKRQELLQPVFYKRLGLTEVRS